MLAAANGFDGSCADEHKEEKKMTFGWGKVAAFVGGALFGTAGVKLLTSKDAKKAYVHTTAAVLRVKDCVMDTVTSVQENCEDILAEAKSVNEARAAAEEQYVEDQNEIIGE